MAIPAIRLLPVWVGVAIGTLLVGVMWFETLERVRIETQEAISAAEHANSNLVVAYEENTAGAFAEIDQVLRFAGAQYPAGESATALSLRRLPMNRSLIRSIGILDHSGKPLFSEGLMPWSPVHLEAFRLHVASQSDVLHIGVPALDPTGTRWSMLVSRRIDGEDGSIVGIAVADVDPAYFAQFFRRAATGSGGVISLIGMDGVSRVRRWLDRTAHGEDMRNSQLLKLATTNLAGSFVSRGNSDGQRRLISFLRMRDYPLVMMVGTDRREALAPVQARARIYYMVSAATTLVIVLAGWGIASVVARQRRQLHDLARAEARLRRTEAHNKAITESMAAGVVTLECDGTIVGVNAAAAAMYGYEPHEMEGMDGLQLAHDSDKACAAAAFANQGVKMEDFRDRPREYLAVRRDGTPFEVEVLTSGFQDADGFTYVCIVQDISERKRMLRELRASEAQFRATFDQALVGIGHVRLDGSFVRVNQRLCDMLGYSQSEMLERRCLDVSHPEHAEYMAAMMRSLAGDGGPSSYQVTRRYVRKDGDILWALASVSLIRQPDGSPDYFVAMIQDITELKRVEQTKNEFVSTVSHELRTPLTSIRGSLGLLCGGVAGILPAPARKLLDIAFGNCERLIRLVNDILDMEKMDSGKMHFKLARDDLAALLPAVLAANEGFAREHGVPLQLVNASAPLYACVDRDRLDQALTNLVSNAVKYSRRGDPVEIRLLRNGGRVRIEVRDHGPGIPAEFRTRMFQKFSQADNSDSRNKTGTGLGLCIAKGIAERMAGDVGYETTLGNGSTFFLELPAVEDESAPIEEAVA